MLFICYLQLFKYWWKLALVGVWSVDWYVHENENGDSLSMHMQEGMENWVGLLKQLMTDKIKPNADWLVRIAIYLDLYVIGGLRENVIDFRIPKQRYKKESSLIWEDGVTNEILFELERQMPNQFKTILAAIDEIEFGNFVSIPPVLTQYQTRQMMSQNERKNMDQIKSGLDEFVRLTMIDIKSEQAISQEELNDDLKEYIKRTKTSKLDNLRNLREITQQRVSTAFPMLDISSREDVSSSQT